MSGPFLSLLPLTVSPDLCDASILLRSISMILSEASSIPPLLALLWLVSSLYLPTSFVPGLSSHATGISVDPIDTLLPRARRL